MSRAREGGGGKLTKHRTFILLFLCLGLSRYKAFTIGTVRHCMFVADCTELSVLFRKFFFYICLNIK